MTGGKWSGRVVFVFTKPGEGTEADSNPFNAMKKLPFLHMKPWASVLICLARGLNQQS